MEGDARADAEQDRSALSITEPREGDVLKKQLGHRLVEHHFRHPRTRRMWAKRLLVVIALPIFAVLTGWFSGSLTAAGAAPAAPVTPSVTTPTIPALSTPTTAPSNDANISIDFGDTDKNGNKKPGQSVV